MSAPENHVSEGRIVDRNCGSCTHFKRTFPNSTRLKEYGSCYWPLPKGMLLPSSIVRSGVKEHEGTFCRVWNKATK